MFPAAIIDAARATLSSSSGGGSALGAKLDLLLDRVGMVRIFTIPP